MKVSVIYNHPNGIMMSLDKKIREAMKSIGCEWYAQGTNMETGIRDIAFDYPIDGETEGGD